MDDILQRRQQVAVIGAGVIGASWVAVFLAHGLKVVVQDPRAGVDAEVRGYVDRASEALKALGCSEALIASGPERLAFEPDLERAVAAADVIQENGPERIEFKRDLWKRVAVAAPAHALLLSSSSALPASSQARDMSAPERMLIGHPFNPPHVIPLVEVVPGARTSPEATREAVAFYTALGKVPQVVHKEIGGFVANRLQAAIFRECVSLVAQGVVTVDELDSIVTHSVGLRWAVDGPFASFNLGGGDVPERISGAVVSPSLFPLLGVEPINDRLRRVLGHPHAVPEPRDGAEPLGLVERRLRWAQGLQTVRGVGPSVTGWHHCRWPSCCRRW